MQIILAFFFFWIFFFFPDFPPPPLYFPFFSVFFSFNKAVYFDSEFVLRTARRSKDNVQ